MALRPIKMEVIPMAILSKGIELQFDGKKLTNLQEIPDMGGEAEAIEITTLADAAHMYMNGLLSYGESLNFKFLYDKAQFFQLKAAEGKNKEAMLTLPDGAMCGFTAQASVKLDSVGTNAPITYTLSLKPTGAMEWMEGATPTE